MTWLKRVGLALAVLLVLLAAALGWLLGTGSGLRFALARAHAFTHGALTVQQAEGRLAGPLQLRGVRYADGRGLDARIARVRLDLRLWPLLAKRVHVRSLDADGIAVDVPPAGGQPQTDRTFSLRPPLDLIVDQAHVGTMRIRRAGAPLFTSDSLDLAGRWTGQGIAVKQLALRAPAGHAELHGELALGTQRSGQGQAGFAWKLGDVEYAGRLEATSDGRTTRATLVLTGPMTAQLHLQVRQDGSNPWTARLAVPSFDPEPLLGSGTSLRKVALDLQASGDRRSATLTGPVVLNDTTLRLQPLRVHLGDDLGTLDVQQLVLVSPQIEGQLAATGIVHLDARPLTAELNLDWRGVKLPKDLAGQELASTGSLRFTGSTAQYHASGQLELGPPGQLAHLALDLDGNRQRIALHTLDVRQPKGRLSATGTVTLQPATRWELKLGASHFDPGAFFAGWNGSLDAELASHGSLSKDGPDASLAIAKLGGTLRGEPVRGEGTLHLSPARVLDGQLALASGNNTVRIQGTPGTANDIDVRLALHALQQWLPDASGRLDGTLHVRGPWRALGVEANVQGRALAWQQQRAGALHLVAAVPDISAPAGTITLDARNVQADGLAFDRIDLRGDGTRASHHVWLDARGAQVSARLALDGSLKAGRWSGTLATLDIEPRGLPRWRLEQPARLGYEAGAMDLAALCLTAGVPRLCLDGKRDKAGKLDANYSLRALPIALLLDAAGYGELPLRTDGALEGSGTIHRSATGVLAGDATLRSAQGSITYTSQAERPLLAWHDFVARMDLGAQRRQMVVRASLSDGGRLDGQMTATGPQQALSGALNLQLNDLAPLELLTAELANVRGALDGRLQVGGTLARPQITGQAAVSGFAAEVPRAGLKLDHGRLLARTADARQLTLDGSVQSGKGTLSIGGQVGLEAGARTRITLTGEQVTAADIPAARVVVSPDLVIVRDAQGIDVQGAVALFSANVNLDRLRGVAGSGAGVVKASPDVVVLDEQEQQQQANARLPVTARVKVDLGNNTHVVGMGLDGKLHGALTVIDRPGRATAGQGQVSVDGTYRAYGQNLTITDGRLLFASTPLDNPGLNIRAVRKLNPNATIDEGQEVGLLISGTARQPILTVFSNPVMEQSDALSYLITGKPLSEVNSGEGNTVNAAAQALGSAAGNLLAKRVGSRLGVDEIGVSSNQALGGSSAFTVGKYLSPRLYISYGVGLFEPGQVITLRYRLSQRWSFEAQNATNFNRASLNYRIER